MIDLILTKPHTIVLSKMPSPVTSAKKQPAQRNICQCPGCNERAPRKFCEQHKRLTECRASGCSKHPTYSIPGAGAQLCGQHKEVEMINVRTGKCGCPLNRYPVFGMPDDVTPSRCSGCKLEGMVDIKNRRCGCPFNRQPNFGMPDDATPSRCFACKKDT